MNVNQKLVNGQNFLLIMLKKFLRKKISSGFIDTIIVYLR